MNQAERRLFLIRELLEENERYRDMEIPTDASDQRLLLRALMNVRHPAPASDAFLEVQDAYLQEETSRKGIVEVGDLEPVRTVGYASTPAEVDTSAPASTTATSSPAACDICLWRGDITALATDAIVNAANSGMTGCYVPNHRCIDNCIHTFAGVQMRWHCEQLMREQGHAEPTGRAKITPAFNLPARYVLHTVGPIVPPSGRVTGEHRELLASCYRSCLELAAQHGLRSIAFCCISTGEFHFPNQLAAQIAVQTVEDFLGQSPTSIERVVFDVFKEEDERIYSELLGAAR